MFECRICWNQSATDCADKYNTGQTVQFSTSNVFNVDKSSTRHGKGKTFAPSFRHIGLYGTITQEYATIFAKAEAVVLYRYQLKPT